MQSQEQQIKAANGHRTLRPKALFMAWMPRGFHGEAPDTHGKAQQAEGFKRVKLRPKVFKSVKLR